MTYSSKEVQIVELALAILPINLSNNTGISYMIHKSRLSGNNIYVVWSDSTTGNADIYSSKEVQMVELAL